MTERPIAHIGQLIEGQKFGWFQAGLIFWTCAFMLIDGYDMQVVGYAAPAIIRAWHSDKAAFSAVFGAGLAGFMVGATLLGNLGDRFGRKRLMLAGAFLFGLFTLACAFAQSIKSLVAFRAIAGLGLGGLIPNAVALMTEYSPVGQRGTRVGILFIGYTIGSAAGGFIAAELIPSYDWPSLFVVGGVLPLILAAAAVLALPESVRFLMLRYGRNDAVGALLHRLRPELALAPNTQFTIQEEEKNSLPVTQLFEGGRALMTPLLWLAFAANMVTLHFLTSWLPTLITESGVPLSHAVIATALLQTGGAVGSAVVGFLLDRIGTLGIVAAFLVAIPSVAGLGHIGTDENALMLVITIAGLCIIGGQVGINALAGTLYPTSMRAAGTGWAFGVGRIGSILGPVVGGKLIAIGLRVANLFAVAAAPILVSASALFVLGRLPVVRNFKLEESKPLSPQISSEAEARVASARP